MEVIQKVVWYSDGRRRHVEIRWREIHWARCRNQRHALVCTTERPGSRPFWDKLSMHERRSIESVVPFTANDQNGNAFAGRLGIELAHDDAAKMGAAASAALWRTPRRLGGESVLHDSAACIHPRRVPRDDGDRRHSPLRWRSRRWPRHAGVLRRRKPVQSPPDRRAAVDVREPEPRRFPATTEGRSYAISDAMQIAYPYWQAHVTWPAVVSAIRN